MRPLLPSTLALVLLACSGCITVAAHDELLETKRTLEARPVVEVLACRVGLDQLGHVELDLLVRLERAGLRVYTTRGGTFELAERGPVPDGVKMEPGGLPCIVLDDVASVASVTAGVPGRRVHDDGTLGAPVPLTEDEARRSPFVVLRLGPATSEVVVTLPSPRGRDWDAESKTASLFWDSSRAFALENGERREEEPGAGSYVAFGLLVPFTVAADVVLLPLEILGAILVYKLISDIFGGK